MNVDFYQSRAMSYRLDTANEIYALLNLGGEIGEVMSLVAKFIRDGGDMEEYKKNMSKELGDIMWMVAAVAKDHNLSLSDICTQNLDKLESRKIRAVIQGSGDNR
jgi:NTP pyrophosphatase (non-canonical NTP hydrolase)